MERDSSPCLTHEQALRAVPLSCVYRGTWIARRGTVPMFQLQTFASREKSMKTETEMHDSMDTEGSLKKSRTQRGPFKLTHY